VDKRRAMDRVERGLDHAQEIYADHGRLFRVMWVAVGVVVVLAGLAMIVVPGPVTIVVPTGLVMLAVVFGWARKLLMVSVDRGVDVTNRVENANRTAQVLLVAASAAVAAAVVAVVVL
jgi:hypothetical protein